ncbi:hypothetical protein BDZ91DRAFT_241036 [Kalaharituber pfeilii]|nr:hypothetical protein BDZ91DRAFT_241036 [Kalaharituber pfeilii]
MNNSNPPNQFILYSALDNLSSSVSQPNIPSMNQTFLPKHQHHHHPYGGVRMDEQSQHHHQHLHHQGNPESSLPMLHGAHHGHPHHQQPQHPPPPSTMAPHPYYAHPNAHQMLSSRAASSGMYLPGLPDSPVESSSASVSRSSSHYESHQTGAPSTFRSGDPSRHLSDGCSGDSSIDQHSSAYSHSHSHSHSHSTHPHHSHSHIPMLSTGGGLQVDMDSDMGLGILSAERYSDHHQHQQSFNIQQDLIWGRR